MEQLVQFSFEDLSLTRNTLLDEALVIDSRRLFSRQKNRIPYHLVRTAERVDWTSPGRRAFALGSILGLLALGILLLGASEDGFGADAITAMIVSGALCALFVIAYFISREQQIVFPCGDGAISFVANRPSRAAVTSFIEALEQRCGPPDGPLDDMERIALLHSRGLIDDQEFELLKHKAIDASRTPPFPDDGNQPN